MDEVEKEWKRFDHDTVEKLQILQCSAMEAPPYIQQFHQLRGHSLNGTPMLHFRVFTVEFGVTYYSSKQHGTRSSATWTSLKRFSEYRCRGVLLRHKSELFADLDSKWPWCSI
ncbi:hypothetical protein GQ600_8080 [Phytophthora cactorum]|nr:hypothetical protein GQ600_8080 [Phytophthora cactorum]